MEDLKADILVGHLEICLHYLRKVAHLVVDIALQLGQVEGVVADRDVL